MEGNILKQICLLSLTQYCTLWYVQCMWYNFGFFDVFCSHANVNGDWVSLANIWMMRKPPILRSCTLEIWTWMSDKRMKTEIVFINRWCSLFYNIADLVYDCFCMLIIFIYKTVSKFEKAMKQNMLTFVFVRKSFKWTFLIKWCIKLRLGVAWPNL